MQKTIKILLYGLQSTWNYGCEAIVRGTLQMLKEHAGEQKVEVQLLVADVALYRKMFQDMQITIVPMRSKWHPRYLFGAVLRKLGITCSAASLVPKNAVKNAIWPYVSAETCLMRTVIICGYSPIVLNAVMCRCLLGRFISGLCPN